MSPQPDPVQVDPGRGVAGAGVTVSVGELVGHPYELAGSASGRLTPAARVALQVAADAAGDDRRPPTVALGRLLDAAPWATGTLTTLDETVSAGAACVDTDPETWFPPHDEQRRGCPQAHAQDRARAGRLCSGCPVQAPCLALSYALRAVGAHGVWGGLSARDRRELQPLWVELHRRLTDPTERADTGEVPIRPAVAS